MFNLLKTNFDRHCESDLDGFSIYFPRAPELEEHPVHSTNIYKAGWSGEGYLVTVSTPGESNKELQKEKLRKYIDFQKIANKLISAKAGKFMGSPYIDLVFFSTTTRPPMYIVERKFYTPEREYKITAANKKQSMAEERFEQFIKGLKLLK